MRRTSATVAALLALASWMVWGTGPAGAAPVIARYGGADRYATAAVVSQARFAPGVPVAFIATWRNFPDALAGGAAGARLGGPILLVDFDVIPQSTIDELVRLAPGRIVILGGPAAVSDAVMPVLDSYTSGPVERWWGPDRYSTAAAVSANTFGPGVGVVFIATGTTFEDALSAGARAGALGGPLLLADAAGLPAATVAELDRLNPASAVVVSTGSVVPDVSAVLNEQVSGSVSRVSAADPSGTSAGVANGVATASQVFLATSLKFPDGLAGGAPGGIAGAPLLLVPGDCVPASVLAQIQRLNPATLVILGGPAAVDPAVESLTPCGSSPTTTTTSTFTTSTTVGGPSNPGDTKNCSDFATWSSANAWFQTYYPLYGDVAKLDQDNDGIPCESLPGAP